MPDMLGARNKVIRQPARHMFTILISSLYWRRMDSCPRVMGMAVYMVSGSGQVKLTVAYWSHILTAQERRIPHTIRSPTGVALNIKVNAEELQKADFIVTKA